MKFILLAAIFAIAFSAAGDVTAVAVSANFYNTTGKVADAMCQLTVTATLATVATASGYNPVWLMDSKTQNSVLVNDTIIFVSMGFTVSSGAFSAPTATAGFYVANAAITVASSAAVTTTNAPAVGTLTTGSSTIASGGTTWSTSFNTSFTQAQYLNSSTSTAGSFFPYQQTASASAVLYTAVLAGNAIGTAAVAATSWSSCVSGYVKLASGATSVIDRLLGSVLAFSFF